MEDDKKEPVKIQRIETVERWVGGFRYGYNKRIVPKKTEDDGISEVKKYLSSIGRR